MNSSRFYKSIPFKIIVSVVLFLVCVTVFSLLLYFPYKKVYETDNNYSIVLVGASSFLRGVDPHIIDEKTQESSYTLATVNAPMYGRYEMLKSALDNKNIKTVVLELSYNTLTKDINGFTRDERVLFFSKIMGINNKLNALRSCFSFWNDEYDQVYAGMLYEGAVVWMRYIMRSDYTSYLAKKGYNPFDPSVRKNEKELNTSPSFNSRILKTDFSTETLEYLEQMIEISQQRGCRVILLTMPLTQNYIWESVGLDKYRLIMNEISDRYNIPYFDFNLLENISSYLDDSSSYQDREHLSKEGSAAFSSVLGEVLSDYLNGTDIRYHFYGSYEEAKEHSVYNTVIN